MNYSTFIVKLLENPQQSSFENDIEVTEVVGEFTTKYKKSNSKQKTLRISAWGDLSSNLMNFYKKGDLLVVEGIISLRKNVYPNLSNQLPQKIIEITVSNLYPYLLNGNLLKSNSSINDLFETEDNDNQKLNYPF